MFMAALHGLGIRRIPTPPEHTYNKPVIDAHLAPLGKSYGSYVIDSLSTIAVITTQNLPDLTGYLKNTQMDFLLERYETSNGDFIVAEARPKFPSNLGAPVIDPQYLDAVRGRKFIAYQNADKSWKPWREINSGVDLTAKFRVEGDPVEMVLDPVTIRSYFIEIAPGGIIDVVMGAYSKLTKPLSIDVAPEGASYSLNWPNNLVWTNDTQTAPTKPGVGQRLHVKIFTSETGDILAESHYYKVS